MSLTLLQAVTALNDAMLVSQTLTPLIQQAIALGKGADDPVTDAELDEQAVAIMAKIEALREADSGGT